MKRFNKESLSKVGEKLSKGVSNVGERVKNGVSKIKSNNTTDKKIKVPKVNVKVPDSVSEKAEAVFSRVNSIKIKLIGGFVVPVVFIVILGIVSYQTASKAIIASYEDATLSTINKTADYYSLMLGNVESVSKEMISNTEAKNYYSKLYRNDNVAENEAYNTVNKYFQAITISNENISNVFVLCDYGRAILTAKINDESVYKSFVGSEEAVNIDENNLVWVTSRSFLDDHMKLPYGLCLERLFFTNGNRACGYLIVDVDLEAVKNPLMDLDLGEGSVVALVAPDGGEITKEEVEGIQFADKQFFLDALADESTSSGHTYVNGGEDLFIYSKLKSGFTVCATVPKAVIVSQASGILVTTIIVVLIALVVALLIGGFLSFKISSSIMGIMKNVEKVADGDLTTKVSVTSKDEFKILANSMNNMIDRTKGMIVNTSDISKEVSESAEKVTDNVQVLLDATRNITDAITGIEHGIIQQASDSEDCMKQMDVLAQQIQVVSSNTDKISQVAEDAKQVVRNGLSSIDELNDKAQGTVKVTADIITEIETLEKASKQISNIIAAINEIADQTSLLSLNASIEAARAGDAGRGFAVVADEIRKLADQSANSANQIKLIVDDIEHKTRETVQIAKKAEDIVASQGESLERTVQMFNQIEMQVGSLANNITGIQGGMQDINSAKNATLMSIQNISAVSQETAASVEEVTATSERQLAAVEQLSGEASELSSTSEQLIETISAFKIE